MSDPIVLAQGITGSLEFHRDRLVLKKKGWPYGHKSEKTIPLRSVSAIQMKEPGLTPGYIQIIFSGSAEKAGAYFSAAQDENSITFLAKQKGPFLQIKDYAEAQIAKASAPVAAVVNAAPTSLADELTKLASLRDQGILTAEEFSAQKTKLLG